MSPGFTIYEVGTSFDWDGDIKVSINFAHRDKFVGYPAISALVVMKRHTLLHSLLWIRLMPRLAYRILIVNNVLANIFFPFGKMIILERLRTSFFLSCRS